MLPYLGIILTATAFAQSSPDILLHAPVVIPPSPIKTNLISLDFQNIDVKSLLQLIAKQSGLNFVISENVKGNITIRLKEVTWRQALNVIMNSQGLASRRDGNVVYISSIEEITSNESKKLQAQDTLANLAPLASRMIRLKYVTAGDLANVLKGANNNLLTTRGQIGIDPRTNSIIIRDTPASIAEVARVVRRLDIPAKQVSIEARIVNVDMIFEEQLGVRFGVSDSAHLSGTFQGANQIASGVQPADVQNAAGQLDPTQRLNFNLPATALFDGRTPGSVALALQNLGPFLIDLELSAMEGENHAKIISSPHVVTSNQQKATIQTGEEIPYQEATSSGATSVVFKKAVLSLEIVPQITPNNKIILNLKATQDSVGRNIDVGSSNGLPVSIPAINTQEVESNILLNDNETIVIGGIYRQSKVNAYDRVPFVSSLPIVGNLFKYKSEHDEKHELLIFITPKIIKPNPVVALRPPYKGEVSA